MAAGFARAGVDRLAAGAADIQVFAVELGVELLAAVGETSKGTGLACELAGGALAPFFVDQPVFLLLSTAGSVALSLGQQSDEDVVLDQCAASQGLLSFA
jgi:hypothetical protein